MIEEAAEPVVDLERIFALRAIRQRQRPLWLNGLNRSTVVDRNIREHPAAFPCDAAAAVRIRHAYERFNSWASEYHDHTEDQAEDDSPDQRDKADEAVCRCADDFDLRILDLDFIAGIYHCLPVWCQLDELAVALNRQSRREWGAVQAFSFAG